MLTISDHDIEFPREDHPPHTSTPKSNSEPYHWCMCTHKCGILRVYLTISNLSWFICYRNYVQQYKEGMNTNLTRKQFTASKLVQERWKNNCYSSITL